MHTYRERLSPSAWIYVSTALVIPASLLVFLPISPTAGIVTAVVLYSAVIGTLVATAPVIAVDAELVVAGRARLPLSFVGDAVAFRGADATLQRGRSLDARAWLVIRGWIDPVVKIEVLDPDDPAPYWLVSTRHPERLVAAIEASRNSPPSDPPPIQPDGDENAERA